MIPHINQGLLFDRKDYKQSPSDPDVAGVVSVDGKIVALVGWEREGAGGGYTSIRVVPWETVHGNPKFYGLTEKQAKTAELNEVEF